MTLDDFVSIPLSSELYQAFARRYPNAVSRTLENVAWDFLERTEDDFDLSPSGGILWGGLKLPNGTELRVKKSRSSDYGYAEIVSDKIIYAKKDIGSPSRFARKIKDNTSVNAWIHVEIKRPNDREWELADTFR